MTDDPADRKQTRTLTTSTLFSFDPHPDSKAG